MKPKLSELKEEIDNSTITVVYFNTTLSRMDRTTKKKINTEIEDLNTIKPLNQTKPNIWISKKHSTQQQNIHSSQEHMEYSLE